MAPARVEAPNEDPRRDRHAGASPTLGERNSLEADSLGHGQRCELFLARLARMSVQERVRAARYGGFTTWERSLWAARFPEQVPLVNGEAEWIALTLADLD